MFISRDWYLFLLVNFLTNVFAFFILFVMPESPRWLIYGGRVDEAIKSLNYIAWFNGCDRDLYIPEDATFEEMAELIATDQTNTKTGLSNKTTKEQAIQKLNTHKPSSKKDADLT